MLVSAVVRPEVLSEDLAIMLCYKKAHNTIYYFYVAVQVLWDFIL